MNTAPKEIIRKPELSEEELRRRRKAVDFARVSCEMEGLYLTDQTYIDLNEQYARGEIEWDVIRNYVDGIIADRKARKAMR